MPKMMRSLNVISRCQSLYRSAQLQGDLCGTQHAFVLAICHTPGRSQEELARRLCLNKSTVARALTQLEDNGYVLRQPNPEDKRQLLVYPTQKMTDAVVRVREISEEWSRQICRGIDARELEIFESVLYRMEAGARALAQGEGEVEE